MSFTDVSLPRRHLVRADAAATPLRSLLTPPAMPR